VVPGRGWQLPYSAEATPSPPAEARPGRAEAVPSRLEATRRRAGKVPSPMAKVPPQFQAMRQVAGEMSIRIEPA